MPGRDLDGEVARGQKGLLLGLAAAQRETPQFARTHPQLAMDQPVRPVPVHRDGSFEQAERSVRARMLTLEAQVTDRNAAFFDAANGFAGCIAGIQEVLSRQGLMAGTLCLNPNAQLSPGQREEIDRVWRAYPHLNDDEFVRQDLDHWLA